MSVGEERGAPDPLHRQDLLFQFSVFALDGETTSHGLLEKACRTASAAWGGPASAWQWSPATGRLQLRAAVCWPEPVEDEADAALAREAYEPGRLAVRPAPALGQLGFQHAARLFFHEARGGGYGFLDVGIPSAALAPGDAAFMEKLGSLLGLALERVSEREQLRTALAARDEQLCEKDLMMQEVHHRVRNSLQLVHTLLTLQARTLRSTEAKHQLEEAAARIIAIGTMHGRLYQGGSVVEGDVGGYLRRVLDDLQDFANDEQDRRIEITTPSLVLPAEKLTPLGLMTAELVTNALKYGRGAIRVAVKLVDGAVEVTVEDEGPGFPADFSPARTSGLGMRIVSALSRAGKSAIRVDRTVPHGRVTVRLLLEENSQAADKRAVEGPSA